MSLEDARHPLLAISDAEFAAITKRFQPRLHLADAETGEWATSPSFCVHALRIHGLRAQFSDPVLTDGAAILRALTQVEFGRKVFDAEILAETRWGVRFRPQAPLPDQRTKADASHIDQNLAALLELGIRLDTPLGLPHGTHTLASVVADAVGNFNLNESELEWTAIALALALPPTRRFRNRFDQEYSFDDIVDALVRKPLDGVSCGGTHVFFALATLAAVDHAAPILSVERRQQMVARIEHLQGMVRQNMRADGSLGVHWFRAKDDPARARWPRSTVADRVTVTGHLGECWLRLPPGLRPELAILQRAGEWLWTQLKVPRDAPAVFRDYCPLTHALVVVDALRKAPESATPR